MNIFATDPDPVACANALDDRRLVKMVLETAQLLSTAVRVACPVAVAPGSLLYVPAHVNHPCSVWARSSDQNFAWLYKHGDALAAEYTRRYNRAHKCRDVILAAGRYLPTIAWAMPDDGSVQFVDVSGFAAEPGDVHYHYRRCLLTKWAADIAAGRGPTWLLRGPPHWATVNFHEMGYRP